MVDSAEHHPDYRETGRFPSREKAEEFLALFKQIRRGEGGVSSLISEFQKFRLPTDPNQFTDSHRPVPQRGVAQRHQRWERDAVDAAVPLTNGADADGEVVWF